MAKKDFAIIGCGRFGSEIGQKLLENNKNVMIIDNDHSVIQKLSKVYDVAIQCDTTDINALEESGVANVKTVIVAIANIESSIMTCANLKELGVKDIIAKAVNHVHRRVLRSLGIPRVIIPEIDIAERIALQCLYSSNVEIIPITSGFSWLKLIVNNESIIGKKLGGLNLRTKMNANVMMIQKQGNIIFPPGPETILDFGDVVTVMCRNQNIQNVVNFFKAEESKSEKSNKIIKKNKKK